MPGPGGREVGRVSVRALPDTSSFARSLERYLERVERTLRVELPVDLDSRDVAATEATLAELTRDRTVNVDIDVNKGLLDRFDKTLKGGTKAIPDAGGLSKSLELTLAVIIAAGALLPVLSTLILALPGLVTAFAAPLGAVLLGLKGIAAAADALTKPFLLMQQAVSDVFERDLTPVFKQLSRIMGPLSKGMERLAESLSGVVGSIVDGLTSDKGLALVSDIFDQLARAIDILAPSLEPLTEAFLILIDEGMKAFVDIAPALAGMTETFAEFVVWAEQTGVLTDAFDFLATIIIGLLTLFFGLVAAGTIMAAAYQRIGEAVGDATDFIHTKVDEAINFLEGVPGRAALALINFGPSLQTAALAAMNQFKVPVAQGLVAVQNFFTALPAKIVEAVGDLSGVLYDAGKALIGGLLDGIVSRFGDVQNKLGELTSKLPDWKGPADRDRRLLYDNGRLVIGGFLDGLESRFGDVEDSLTGLTGGLVVPAMPGSAFVPQGGFTTAAGDGSKRLKLSVRDREFDAFLEEVADSRVDAARSIDGMAERAFGS